MSQCGRLFGLEFGETIVGTKFVLVPQGWFHTTLNGEVILLLAG
jgi:CelD/BcsL family acetyltransferase involved in cellulose biosynthesis